MPIKKWIGKQTVVYPHNVILFGNKKEWNIDTTKTWLKNPDQKIVCIVLFHLYTNLENAN